MFDHVDARFDQIVQEVVKLFNELIVCINAHALSERGKKYQSWEVIQPKHEPYSHHRTALCSPTAPSQSAPHAPSIQRCVRGVVKASDIHGCGANTWYGSVTVAKFMFKLQVGVGQRLLLLLPGLAIVYVQAHVHWHQEAQLLPGNQ